MARESTLLLLLEDLHWAEESSLFVFKYLARNVRGEKVLIMATTRPREGEMAQKTVNAMKEEGTLTGIDLGGLDEKSVGNLVDSMYQKNDFPGDFVGNLTEQCKGNPFFLTEMLRQMGDEEAIIRENGTSILVNKDFSIPSSVEDVVHKRLMNLEPDAMAMAEYAACIGREFDRNIAASLDTLTDPQGALQKLNGNGILTMNNGSAEFAHAIIHDVTYRSIGPRWKTAYHKSVGE
jgi:predicted ATPase